MTVRASIDLGTNTCLLLIGEWDPKERKVSRTIKDLSTVVRLGQGVDRNKRLAPEAMERTLNCLRKYADEVKVKNLEPKSVICVATSQARDAENGADFFQKIEKETGFRFQTISGDQEAKWTFEGGLLPQMDPTRSAVIDIGGGSTEFMSQKGGLSLDMGSVRFTERYLKSDPVTDEEFWACRDAVEEMLQKAKAWRDSNPSEMQLVGVAGTATTLAAWHLELTQFNAEKINEVTLTRGDLHRMVEELKWRSVEERKQLTGIEEGRADVLLAGALILWRSMEVLKFPTLQISTRGLRYGALQNN